jgi:hypothetical protein
MLAIRNVRRVGTVAALAFVAVLAILIAHPAPSKAATVLANPATITTVKTGGFPVADCATTVAIPAAAILGVYAGVGATAATTATAFFGTTGATFGSALIGIAWGIKDPLHNCKQHIGNSAATAICSASNFSASDPRGNAARLIVWFATGGGYTRCAP